MKQIIILSLLMAFVTIAHAKEYHVSVKGNDKNTGSETSPFRTIGRAAQEAYPGDVITVHAGVYREWVNPPRGGESDDKRIVYRAAPGEKVEIKGSEQINTWKKDQNGLWKLVLPNIFFGDDHPYRELICGDWFSDHGRKHHTGEVFLNNRSLYEKESLEKAMNPEQNQLDPEGSKYTWYCETDEQNTTIWANFQKSDPNKELVEISVRRTCFYPEKQGVNYITISGFYISQAATQWAAPTAEQIGMIATHWNKGWIIENNVISNSKCSGITLGKERATGHNVWLQDGSIDGSLHYIEVTFRTIRNGWNKDNIGSHIIRNNEIFACEQTGICGSMGAAFSIIENNHIHHIWTKRQFSGAEIGGIKFHAAIDTQIRNNRIHHAGRGLWLDWMAQGTRVSNNLFYGNDLEDLFVEVNHGPFLVDNNIFGSPLNLRDQSQGGAYVHNLFAGKIVNYPEITRYTPYFLPHSTDVEGLSIIVGGDNRFFNNLFTPAKQSNDDKIAGKYGLAEYQKAKYPMQVEGNIYFAQNIPFGEEKNNKVFPVFATDFKIDDKGNEVYVSFLMKELNNLQTETITTEKLGKAKLPKQFYEQPDGQAIIINTDYFGRVRSKNPTPGPFEQIKEGEMLWKLW